MYDGQQLSYWRTALQINLKAFRTQTFAEPRQGRLCLEDLSSASLIFAIHCMWKRPSQSRMNCSLLGSFRIQLQIAFDSMRPKRTNCMFDRLHGLLRRATKPTRCLYKPDTLAKFQRYHWKARFTATLTRSAPRKALFKKPALLQGSVLYFVANVCGQRMNVGVQVQILCFSPLSALIFGGFAATIRLWDRLCTNAQLKHILDTRLQDPSLSETKASKLTSHISWTCLRTSMDTVRLYKVCGSRWDGASILTKVHCLGCLYSLFHWDLSAMDKESSLWKDTFSVYDV